MSALHDYPPYQYLEIIAQHAPKAVHTYMQLWNKIDKDNKVCVEKDTIRTEFMVSKAKFNHDLVCLVKEGLANVNDSPNFLEIELVGWEDEELDDC